MHKIKTQKSLDIHRAVIMKSMPFSFKNAILYIVYYFYQLYPMTHFFFRNKNIYATICILLSWFCIRTCTFGKCQCRIHTVGSRFRNVTERFHLGGSRAWNNVVSRMKYIIPTPSQAIIMCLHITCRVELAVLTALWKENPPKIK